MLTVGEVEEREGGRGWLYGAHRTTMQLAEGRGQTVRPGVGCRFRRHTMAVAAAAAAKQHHCRKGREEREERREKIIDLCDMD